MLATPATRLRSSVGEGRDADVLGPEGAVLDPLDLLIVGGLPRGAVEQVIFRMDALRALADHGVRCVNTPRAIEWTVDKSWASALLARAGRADPGHDRVRTLRRAMQAFATNWAATSGQAAVRRDG